MSLTLRRAAIPTLAQTFLCRIRQILRTGKPLRARLVLMCLVMIICRMRENTRLALTRATLADIHTAIP